MDIKTIDILNEANDIITEGARYKREIATEDLHGNKITSKEAGANAAKAFGYGTKKLREAENAKEKADNAKWYQGKMKKEALRTAKVSEDESDDSYNNYRSNATMGRFYAKDVKKKIDDKMKNKNVNPIHQKINARAAQNESTMGILCDAIDILSESSGKSGAYDRFNGDEKIRSNYAELVKIYGKEVAEQMINDDKAWAHHNKKFVDNKMKNKNVNPIHQKINARAAQNESTIDILNEANDIIVEATRQDKELYKNNKEKSSKYWGEEASKHHSAMMKHYKDECAARDAAENAKWYQKKLKNKLQKDKEASADMVDYHSTQNNYTALKGREAAAGRKGKLEGRMEERSKNVNSIHQKINARAAQNESTMDILDDTIAILNEDTRYDKELTKIVSKNNVSKNNGEKIPSTKQLGKQAAREKSEIYDTMFNGAPLKTKYIDYPEETIVLGKALKSQYKKYIKNNSKKSAPIHKKINARAAQNESTMDILDEAIYILDDCRN